MQQLELRSKTDSSDPVPQNLLRFWLKVQLLVSEVNPLRLRWLATIDSQSTEVVAVKLLRVKSGQSPTSTSSRTINLHN